MDTTNLMVSCIRSDVCENLKCDHRGLHEVVPEALGGKSICFHESCGGKYTVCQPVDPTWEV